MTTVTTGNFEQEVLKAAKPVVLDFWAPWCGYCRRLEPVMEKMSGDYAQKLTIAKVNIDEEPQLAQQFSINTIPTLLLFQNGKAGKELVGPPSKAVIDQWLKEQGTL